jgi:hypothetical protein
VLLAATTVAGRAFILNVTFVHPRGLRLFGFNACIISIDAQHGIFRFGPQ